MLKMVSSVISSLRDRKNPAADIFGNKVLIIVPKNVISYIAMSIKMCSGCHTSLARGNMLQSSQQLESSSLTLHLSSSHPLFLFQQRGRWENLHQVTERVLSDFQNSFRSMDADTYCAVSSRTSPIKWIAEVTRLPMSSTSAWFSRESSMTK